MVIEAYLIIWLMPLAPIGMNSWEACQRAALEFQQARLQAYGELVHAYCVHYSTGEVWPPAPKITEPRK